MKAQILSVLVVLALSNSVLAQEMSASEAQDAADTQEAALQASLSEGSSAVSTKAPVSTPVKTAPLYEASCKIKAKEAAAQIFRTCMTDGKNAQLEQIRKEYQQKLSAMRADYEKELGRLSKLKKEAQSENKKEETQKSESMTIELKPAPKEVKSKTPKTVKSKTAQQKFTKKGLPLKTVKSTLTEMNNAKSDDSVMTVSLKPAKSMEFSKNDYNESQEVPEPVAIEKLENKTEEKVTPPSASIQLD